MTEKPRVLLFTGDGKGKTTAALGMVLRMTGHGRRACIIQFMKKRSDTGESVAVNGLSGCRIVQVGRGFVPPPDNPKFEQHQEAARQGLALAAAELKSGDWDLIVLDEVCGAVHLGLLDADEVAAAVDAAPASTVVVLTGRRASPALLALADTATEMRCIKHGFFQGLPARPGVEF